MKAIIIFMFLLISNIAIASDFGAYMGAPNERVMTILSTDKSKKSAIIEPENFTAEEIKALKANNCQIYSYINVGAIENWRDYFEEYKNITIKPYKNWSEEYWINAGEKQWQDFVVDTLAKNAFDKGTDGFFLDNFDLYYFFESDEIYDGLALILAKLQKYGKKIIINGGDTFVDTIIRNGMSSLIYGVCQESVFTRITNYKQGKFSKQKSATTKYYIDYLEKAKKAGVKIFVIEYAKSPSIASDIAQKCSKSGYHYYISESLELDGRETFLY